MPRRTYVIRFIHRDLCNASMRPGRNAPENACMSNTTISAIRCFNEAGAKCPGELPGSMTGKVAGDRASMRPGRNAPENGAIGDVDVDVASASMRPGRNAPENSGIRVRSPASSSGFNEAGAKCPGEQSPDVQIFHPELEASMRPGRNAPENRPLYGLPELLAQPLQ